MQSRSHLNHPWLHMCRDVQAIHREHVVIFSLSDKVTAWQREVTTAWMCRVRLAQFLLHSSFMEATLQRKERMAADLLAFHSFTPSCTSTYSLIHLLWGVYRRQVSTIGGATLHMVSMSHQKYVVSYPYSVGRNGIFTVYLFSRVLQCAHSSSSGPTVDPLGHPHKTAELSGPA